MSSSLFCITLSISEVLNTIDLDSGDGMMFPHIGDDTIHKLVSFTHLPTNQSQYADQHFLDHKRTKAEQSRLSQDPAPFPTDDCTQNDPHPNRDQTQETHPSNSLASEFPQNIWIDGDRSFSSSDTSLGEQALYYYQQGCLTEALQSFEAQLLEQQSQGDLMGMGETLIHIGRIRTKLGGEAKALLPLEQAFELASASHASQLQGQSLYELGHAARVAGLPLKAIQYFKKAASLFAEISDDQSAGYALTELGKIYGGLGRYDRNHQLCAIAADILREVNDLSGEAAAVYHCGVAAYHREEYQEAIARLEQASTIYLAAGDTLAEANSRSWLGHAYREQQMTRCAMCCYWDAWKLCAEVGDRQGTLTNLVELGQIYEREDMLLSALDAYHQAIELYPGVSLPSSFFDKARLCERTGAIEQAVHCYRQLILSCKPFDSEVAFGAD